MTEILADLVDVYPYRGAGTALECLTLRRAAGGRCPGSWEAVHGHLEGNESPTDAARRELLEETGLVPRQLYNLSRVELFFQHDANRISLVPAFAALVGDDDVVTLSSEHDAAMWLAPVAAGRRVAWPRSARCFDDLARLLGGGDAGPLEDVLHVP